MAYSTAGKNLMLDALRGTTPTAPITHVATYDSATLPATTSVASTDIFTSTAHGLAAGSLGGVATRPAPAGRGGPPS